MRTFAIAEVKAVADGSFEAILSVPTLDRDGEIIDSGAFAPLPESIPVHAFHDFADPIGRGVPAYKDDVLFVRGTFATTERAQEIRTLVREGVIGAMSVGFMAADRQTLEDGVTHIVRAELLEGSFVSVPSNREAAVLVAKSAEYDTKSKADRLQQIHDLAVANGAACDSKHHDVATGSTNGGTVTDIQFIDNKFAATEPAPAADASAPAADAPVDVATTLARALADASTVAVI